MVYRKKNGHISKASNSALELVSGEFTVLMDQDDLLREDAFYEFVKLINQKSNVDMIYSDENKIDENGFAFCPLF